MPHAHITKIEDARTGQWLRHLDPVTDPIKRIDMGWTMGDWNQLDVSTETVGLREFIVLPCVSLSYPSLAVARSYTTLFGALPLLCLLLPQCFCYDARSAQSISPTHHPAPPRFVRSPSLPDRC